MKDIYTDYFPREERCASKSSNYTGNYSQDRLNKSVTFNQQVRVREYENLVQQQRGRLEDELQYRNLH